MTQNRLPFILNITLASLIVIAVTLATVFVFRSVNTPVWNTSEPIGYNIYSPDVINDSHVHYYTGNTFATLNTKTGERTALTSHYTLPDVSAIHWLKNGVVFLSQSAEDFTDLGAKVNEIQGSSDDTPLQKLTPTYWYLSFTDDTLTSLKTSAYDIPETTILSTSDGGFVFKTDDTHFARLSPDGIVTYDVFSVAGDIRPVYASEKELYYLETNLETNVTSIRKVTAGTNKMSEVVYEQLYKSGEGTITSHIVSQDGNTYYYEFSKGDEARSIKKLDVSQKKVSTFIGDFQGMFAVNSREVTISSLRNNSTDITVIPKSGEVKSIRFTSTDNKLALRPVAASVGDAILYTVSSGESVIVYSGNTAPTSYVARDEAFEKKIQATSQYSLYRDIDDISDTSYSLILAEGYYVPVVDAFKADLTRAGMSPYEIKLSLSPGMRVTSEPTNQSAAPTIGH